MTKIVLIVESPTKAVTIKKMLPANYKVIASNGHIRDVALRNGVTIDNNRVIFKWESNTQKQKIIEDIIKEISDADEIICATDSDREGEAMSYHCHNIYNEQKQQNTLKPNVKFTRAVFHEITPKAILNAIQSTRDIDEYLVYSYFARRALDYLFGFGVSPVLWKKLYGIKSAGRVQSTALKLTAEKEKEIMNFQSILYYEYICQLSQLSSKRKVVYEAKLTHVNGNKIESPGITDANVITKIQQDLTTSSKMKTCNIDRKVINKNPSPPFITSTLQQAAHNKYGYSAAKTMKLAQKLYELGLITYVRTDNVMISGEVLPTIRQYIASNFGDEYLSPTVRIYENKVKNAQEAHECIRPTNIILTPESVTNYPDKASYNIYFLIWAQTLASQMSNAKVEKYTISFADMNNVYQLTSTLSQTLFDGFEKAYFTTKQKSTDTEYVQFNPDLINTLAIQDLVTIDDQQIISKNTNPPHRYTESSLIRTLENLGIGRPSTYASITTLLEKREYITLINKSIHPQEKGYILILFLLEWFTNYINYNFTAEMEDELDRIAKNKGDWQTTVLKFHKDLNDKIAIIETKSISDVINCLNQSILMQHTISPENIDDNNNTNNDKNDSNINDTQNKIIHQAIDLTCSACKTGQMSVKFSKQGVFLGCNRYPNCNNTTGLFDLLFASHNLHQSLLKTKSLQQNKNNHENNDNNEYDSDEDLITTKSSKAPFIKTKSFGHDINPNSNNTYFSSVIQQIQQSTEKQLLYKTSLEHNNIDLSSISKNNISSIELVTVQSINNNIFYYAVCFNEQNIEKYTNVTNFVKDNSLLIGFDDIVSILSCPKKIGLLQKSKQEISLRIGPYGPFLSAGKQTCSVKNIPNWWKIDIVTANDLIAQHSSKNKSTKKWGSKKSTAQPKKTN